MTNSTKRASAPDAYEPLSPLETLEDDASVAGLAAGEALRAAEVALIVFFGLLICPPLLILVVCLVLPLLVIALVVGLLGAVLSAPYLLVHHLRSPDRRHASLLGHRLRGVGHAVSALAPHRIVADARKLGTHHR